MKSQIYSIVSVLCNSSTTIGIEGFEICKTCKTNITYIDNVHQGKGALIQVDIPLNDKITDICHSSSARAGQGVCRGGGGEDEGDSFP